jgi:hypothetical protein
MRLNFSTRAPELSMVVKIKSDYMHYPKLRPELLEATACTTLSRVAVRLNFSKHRVSTLLHRLLIFLFFIIYLQKLKI